MKIYTEYGLDFDNNRFGIGRSVEIESEDGKEYRTKEKVVLKNKRYYVRIWVGKKVFVLSRKKGVELVSKHRHNFKIVLGIQGEEDA